MAAEQRAIESIGSEQAALLSRVLSAYTAALVCALDGDGEA
jgi:hypothetical protein